MTMVRRAMRALDRVSLAVPMALLLGAALAFALFAMPGWWISRALGATGIADIVPLLAPPLGRTIRLLIALGGGLAGAVPVYALFAWLERPRRSVRATMPVAQLATAAADAAAPVDDDAPAADAAAPVSEAPVADAAPAGTRSRFAWLRGTPPVAPEDGTPLLRRQDAHPDAPARRPIFAASDLGAPLDEVALGWAPADDWGAPRDDDAPLLLDAAWQAAPAAETPEAPDASEAPSAAALLARLDAALMERPGRPASPPRAGEAMRNAMADLRRASRR